MDALTQVGDVLPALTLHDVDGNPVPRRRRRGSAVRHGAVTSAAQPLDRHERGGADLDRFRLLCPAHAPLSFGAGSPWLDAGVGLAGGPREPERLDVLDLVEPFARQRTVQGGPDDVPPGPGPVVDEGVAVEVKGDHGFLVLEVPNGVGSGESGFVDGRDPIRWLSGTGYPDPTSPARGNGDCPPPGSESHSLRQRGINMTRTRRLLAVGAALALTAAACGDTTPPESANTGGTSAEATVVGDDLAFDVTALDAVVGEALSITFDNREDGIAHNLHVEGTATGDAKTDIEEGPTTQTLDVSFDEAGEFEYLCDVHPQQMRGTVTVTS